MLLLIYYIIMGKYKRNERSRSRSRSPKNKKKDSNSNRQNYKSRDRYRQHSPKNKKKHYSSSSKSSQSSGSSRSRNEVKYRNKPKDESRSRSKSKSKSLQKNSSHNRSSPSSSNPPASKRRQQGNPEHSHNRYKDSEPRYKIEQTKVLKIQNCVDTEHAQRALTDASINAATSVPDQIQLRQGAIYAKYPSIEVSVAIKQLLKQKITINGMEYRINFYPFKRIDLNLAYDWFCDRCEYKNFARRNKCYRCDNQRNPNCKFDYNSASNPVAGSGGSGGSTTTGGKGDRNNPKEENINNCSLMIRGPVITDTEEEVILDLFQTFCSVKDIRMIRNKMTGQLKDFAFIQFFTPQEAALALKHSTSPDFRIKGQKVSVMYSRNKSQEEYIKPLPYEKRPLKKQATKSSQPPPESYYTKQRQLELQQQKLRPIITLEQLKQKHELEMKKKAANARQLTQQQLKRRQAENMARQWEKEAKMQNTILYMCVICRRKFKNEQEMKLHATGELHQFNKNRIQLAL